MRSVGDMYVVRRVMRDELRGKVVVVDTGDNTFPDDFERAFCDALLSSGAAHVLRCTHVAADESDVT